MQKQETYSTLGTKPAARLVIERIGVPLIAFALLATLSMRGLCKPPEDALRQRVSASYISRVITVVAVGDVSLARGVKNAVDEGTNPFDSVRDVVISADLAICNLECALTDETEYVRGKGPYGGGIYLAGRPGSSELLADAGFDIICLANNHTMDYGRAGLDDTMDALESAGLVWCGAGPDEGGASVPAVYDVDGLRVCCLAFNEVEPRSYSAGPDEPGVAWLDKPTVLDRVAKADGKADIVIVSLHWGVEGIAKPTRTQRDLAKAVVDAGADVVLGHHAHVLGPVETYDRAIVAYGLGNFVFDTVFRSGRTSAVLTIYVDRRTGPVGYALTPVYIEGVSPRLINGSAPKFVTRVE
ncbi:MAG: CapA family protein [Candidatus Coatesbacteria bacterium]|nr:MAG: CapA family protein [Candidatus Coatesbacteria bacterium]